MHTFQNQMQKDIADAIKYVLFTPFKRLKQKIFFEDDADFIFFLYWKMIWRLDK